MKTFQVTFTLQTDGQHNPASIGHWLTELVENTIASELRKTVLLSVNVKEVK